MNQSQYKVNVRRMHSTKPFEVHYSAEFTGLVINKVTLGGHNITA